MRERRRPFRRLVTWCAVLGYALIISGMPLGSLSPSIGRSAAAAKRLAVKDRSTPFPCMDTPCGCVSAEQCFTDCCCRSPAETLAWARANQVTADVLLALQRRAAGPAASEATGSCCAAAGDDLSEVCFEYDYLASDKAAGTAAELAATASDPTAADAVAEPVSRRTLVLKSLLRCGGLVTQWLAAGVCLPLTAVTAVVCGEPLPAAVNLKQRTLLGERDEPAAPPPRLG